MKIRAKYRKIDANPFLPDIRDFLRQFREAEADVPDDTSMEQLEEWAKEITPEGFEFMHIKKFNH